MREQKEKIRKTLLERYLSTGKVGLIKPKDNEEAIDLIETVVELYDPKPVKYTLSDIADRFKNMLS